MPIHLKSVGVNSEKFPCKDHYPFSLPFLYHTKKIAFDRQVTLFAGENGSGKSTLLEGLATACGIHIWRNTERSRCIQNPYEYDLAKYISLDWENGRVPGSFFGSDIFTNFTEILDAWAASDPGQLEYFGGRSLTTLSHGQSIMTFFRNRYKIKGLYLLDEPETALSPRTQLELLSLIEESTSDGHAQFIIATHSPILLSIKGASIYSFDNPLVKKVSYTETDHYRIYKEFMAGQ
jgi:predicted ATPase